MARKSIGMSYVGWAGGGDSPLMRRWLLYSLAAMLTVALVAALAFMAGGGPAMPAGVAAGIEASASRWSVLAADVAPDFEALGFGMDADTVRWNALPHV